MDWSIVPNLGQILEDLRLEVVAYTHQVFNVILIHQRDTVIKIKSMWIYLHFLHIEFPIPKMTFKNVANSKFGFKPNVLHGSYLFDSFFLLFQDFLPTENILTEIFQKVKINFL